MRPTLIESQLGEIGDAVGRQQKAIEELSCRIAPILAPGAPGALKKDEDPPEPILVPLANRLRDIRAIITKANTAIPTRWISAVVISTRNTVKS